MSGLIFVALALVWAVVLLPKALRHQDDLAQTRSVVEVSDSARVLARREAVDVRKAELFLRPERAHVVPTPPASAAAPAPVSSPTNRIRSRVAAQRKAAAAAAARRRRILVVLVLADVVVALLAALARLPLWAVAVPVGLTVAFLVTARLTVRRDQARFATDLAGLRSREAQRTVTSEDVAAAAPVAAPTPVAAAAPVHNEQGLEVVTGLDDTASFPVGLLDAAAAEEPGALWDPLPVTLPTYVHKPRAQRSVRTIDLQAAGVVSSGHDAAASALVADAATSAPPDDLPQRAVGS
jgi:hypothetical protein